MIVTFIKTELYFIKTEFSITELFIFSVFSKGKSTSELNLICIK